MDAKREAEWWHAKIYSAWFEVFHIGAVDFIVCLRRLNGDDKTESATSN